MGEKGTIYHHRTSGKKSKCIFTAILPSLLRKLKNEKLLNLNEYKKLLEQNIILDIEIISDSVWNITFVNIKKNAIKIQIIFSNYPILPPNLKFLTNVHVKGLIDKNENIVISLIEPTNWKITNNLVQITNLLFECLENSL